MSEVWKQILGYECYEISNQGRVRHIFKTAGVKLLKPCPASSGRLHVTLCKNNTKFTAPIHSLVLRAFSGNPPTDQHECAHNDGNYLNNSSSNLRWATAKENAQDRDKHGRTARGSKNGSAKLREEDVIRIRTSHYSPSYWAKKLRILPSSVRDIKNRRRNNWSHV